nr:MAG TPA: hypothetical protein [Bacteriophage sp.]DAP28940.1 MAG TPA: hypothetical protein [Caudoviricetes sp.]DAU54194.1 MAG TPA: hypothetical protein [Bacteriophage sp.]
MKITRSLKPFASCPLALALNSIALNFQIFGIISGFYLVKLISFTFCRARAV